MSVCFFTGCGSVETEQQTPAPIFYPELPETPRLQFLKSFSGPEDLGTVKTSAFERFVLGQPETEDGITRPYGIAIFEGKLYVCDVGRRMVEVLDFKNRTFGYLTKDRRLTNPVNIYIDRNGMKYIADPTVGAVFVFDRNNNLNAILGKELNISPIDVVVRGPKCYITDFKSNQIIVLDKISSREITRIGKKSESTAEEPLENLAPGEISFISDLALDQEGNIYVTDKAGARITEFDNSGSFKRTIGRVGRNIDEFVRPKGIAIDNDNRIWVVDAGSEVAKIYNQQAQLLLFFGLPGNESGMMNLPAKIILDYDNVELFEKYAVDGADIEFLVLVSNQYGPNKVSVYGFGTFSQEENIPEKTNIIALETEPEKTPEQQVTTPSAPAKAESGKTESSVEQDNRKIADLYYQSMAYYRGGQLEKAREGFTQVINSGLIPPEMVKTINGHLADINNRLNTDTKKKQIADLYYQSMVYYRGGQLEKAREGFVKVMNSGLVPPEMANSIQSYINDIDNALANKRSGGPR